MKFLELARTYKRGIIFILSLVLIENIAWIIEPTVFGKLIDAFIEGGYKNSLRFQEKHLLPLLLWVLLYVINSGTGTLRRKMEPRVYQKIYVDMATRISKLSLKKDLDISKAASRTQLSQEYITFFQYRIPEIFEQTIAILGTIIAVTAFDWRISAACTAVALPLIFIGIIYNKRVMPIEKELHDKFENIYNSFASKETENVRATYKSMGKLQERIGNWGALNFGSMRLIMLVIFIVVLYISIDLDDFSTGKIYSIVAYLWTFVSSVEYIPELMESSASLRDISERLQIEE